MSLKLLDYMEYSSDANAQEAYVTSATGGYTATVVPTMTSNTAPSGVASANTEYDPGYQAWKAFDGVITGDSNGWHSLGGAPNWLKYQFASSKIITRYTIKMRGINVWYPIAWTFQGSNNGSDWTTLDTQSSQSFSASEKKTYSFTNTTSYLYYQLYITSTYGGYTVIQEVEMMESITSSLQSYSESTIKTQGSYALKGVAAITDSLNKTLTRTVSPTIDLSGLKNIKFNIRSNRTGSNIKIGLRDSGGTTIEVTPNIIEANKFQEVIVDISAVSDANKDAIDTIIITQVNADSATTYYIDNMYALNSHKRIILV